MAPVILALDVHCDSCARKIRKAVKKVPGVDGVTASVETGLVMVDGNADAATLRAVIQDKMGNTVTIVSDGEEVGTTAAGSGTVTSWPPTPLAPASPAASIVLEMDLHCRSCAKKVEKRVMKIPGVETVTTDVQAGRVEVTGTADASTVARRIQTSTSMVPRIVRDNPRRTSAADVPEGYDSPAAPGEMSWYGGQNWQQGGQMYGQQWTAPAYPPPVGNYYSGQGGEAYGYGGQRWGAPPPPVGSYYSSGQVGEAYGYGGGEQWGAPPVGNYYSSGQGEAYQYGGEQWAAPSLENDEPSCVVQ